MVRSREALAKQALLPAEPVIGRNPSELFPTTFHSISQLLSTSHFTSSVHPYNLPNHRERVDCDMLRTARIYIEHGLASGQQFPRSPRLDLRDL